jgi:DNA-binding transcriptional LysR family regulator
LPSRINAIFAGRHIPRWDCGSQRTERLFTVARERSFSRAAQKLFTQPAVGIAIRKLEESIGEPLRTRRATCQPTDAGKLLAGYAERS